MQLPPALLGLWCCPAAIVPIQPLAWELSYATGAFLKSKKKLKNKNKKAWQIAIDFGIVPIKKANV